jgi:rhamnose transport system substrate-binding protein
MRIFRTVAAAAAFAVAFSAGTARAETVKIALVVKALGIGFFEAANKGAQEAAKELGNVEVIYTGPTGTTAEAQIEVINALIAQNVSAIAVSANDKDALVPALKKAMQRGITVISWDSGVAPEGRQMHLNPSSNALIGNMCVKLAADSLPGGAGEVAILSASATATNQNTWIAEMKKVLPNYPGVKLVTTVYGDDLADKSYRETQGLIQSHPNLKAIIAPTSVGIVAAAKALQDEGLCDEVKVSGLGLPSEMLEYTMNGCAPEFALWSFVDLGYLTYYASYLLATGAIEGVEGETFMAGRMGEFTITKDPTRPDIDALRVLMGPFTIYNKDNVEEAAG